MQVVDTRLFLLPLPEHRYEATVAVTIEKLLLETDNGTLLDHVDITKELALYAKDLRTFHLKLKMNMFPDLVKTYNESHHKISNVTNVRTIADLLNNVSNSEILFGEVYKLTKIFYYSRHYCNCR